VLGEENSVPDTLAAKLLGGKAGIVKEISMLLNGR
jgi:hypothetical protein